MDVTDATSKQRRRTLAAGVGFGLAFAAGLAALLAGLGVLVARGALAREPVAMFSALFAVGALALIAFGRSELAGTTTNRSKSLFSSGTPQA